MGRVFDYRHYAVAQAHVILLGTPLFTSSDDNGEFSFSGIKPGDYRLRVDKAEQRPYEGPVPVKAGAVTRVEVQLMPLAALGEGDYKPHLHDYWGDRTEVPLVRNALGVFVLATATLLPGVAPVTAAQPGPDFQLIGTFPVPAGGAEIGAATPDGRYLAVTAADCLPILYVTPRAVAAAHAGWRGTADGAPEAALSAVCPAGGVAPDTVGIHFGPGIRGCCYQVGPGVAERFPVWSLSEW